MKKPVLFILIIALAIPWLFSLAAFRFLQLYADSLFTIGAGARLAACGHFGQTFLLYGLVNPRLLELLLTLGAGGEAAYVLRILQLALALLGIWGLTLTMRQFTPGKQSGGSPLSWLLLAFLGSPIFLVESFELTPEISMFAAISWLLFASLSYDGSFRRGALLAVLMAFTVGTRPSAVVLWIPALIAACSRFHGSALKQYWRWALSVVPVLALLCLTALPSAGLKVIVVSISILMGMISLTAFISDFRRGLSGYWLKLSALMGMAVLLTIILFPSYFIHFRLLISQITEFHLSREIPLDSLPGIASNALLGAASIFLLTPELRFHFHRSYDSSARRRNDSTLAGVMIPVCVSGSREILEVS